MVFIPGGEFTMGSEHGLARADERPLHRVRVSPFWMDATEVTNAQFAAFVKATGYKTVAEHPVDWEALKRQLPPDTPKPDESRLQPGALVFTPPTDAVDLAHFERWWTWTPGADWRHPRGPQSSIEGHESEPVVQVCLDDAQAYARWAGKRLPTEAEWEFAARGGLEGKANVWGDEPIDPRRANTWQGHFPDRNTVEDGCALAAPVGRFPPNGYGLFDMAGNVWEWCSDRYRPDAYALCVQTAGPGGVTVNPQGPGAALDVNESGALLAHVVRGGSFLCNDSYCSSYRPSARMSETPDTATQHIGFRCVKDAAR
jgi:formylglycine-generating enzyme